MDDELASGLGFDGDAGALVASVVPDSPADKAGVLPGDVIVGINGEDLERLKELTRKVAAVKPGEEVEIEVWRNGERETLDVAIGRSPKETHHASQGQKANKKAQLGISLGELSPQWRQRLGIDEDLDGAVIVNVEPESPAAARGLRPGDVVVMVGQTPVRNLDETMSAIADVESEGRDSVLLRVVRGSDARFVVVPFA